MVMRVRIIPVGYVLYSAGGGFWDQTCFMQLRNNICIPIVPYSVAE